MFIKRMLCIILAVMFLLTVGACGGTTTPAATTAAATTAAATTVAETTAATTAAETTAAETTAATTAAETSAAAQTADWAAPFPDPVTIHVAYSEDTGAVWSPGESQADNMWTRRWKKLYNVDVVMDWVSTDYATKLNLAIASGSIPDAFTANIVQLKQLETAGLIQPLNDAYDKNASNSYKKRITDFADILEVAKEGDQIMAMPQLHYGYDCETNFNWYRQDWYKKAGEPVVSTIPQYEALMATFMKDDKAKFGLTLDKTLDNFFRLNGAFHAASKIWVDAPDGSGIVYGATLPETKAQLATYADWYKKGYIRKDFASLDNAAMFEDALKGNVGTTTYANWSGWVVGKQLIDSQGPGTYFMAHQIPAVDDKKVMYPVAFNTYDFDVVRKGYEHPDVLIKLISDYSLVLNDSIAAGTMTVAEVMPFGSNNMHHAVGPFKVLFDSYNDVYEVHNAFMTGVEKFSTGYASLYYNEAKKWVDSGDSTSLGRWLQMGTKDASLFMGNLQVDNGQILKSKLWGPTPQAVLDLGSTLDDLLVEGFTKIIMGVQPISYYDTVMTNWRKAGGDEETTAVNTMYGKK